MLSFRPTVYIKSWNKKDKILNLTEVKGLDIVMGVSGGKVSLSDTAGIAKFRGRSVNGVLTDQKQCAKRLRQIFGTNVP